MSYIWLVHAAEVRVPHKIERNSSFDAAQGRTFPSIFTKFQDSSATLYNGQRVRSLMTCSRILARSHIISATVLSRLRFYHYIYIVCCRTAGDIRFAHYSSRKAVNRSMVRALCNQSVSNYSRLLWLSLRSAASIFIVCHHPGSLE